MRESDPASLFGNCSRVVTDTLCRCYMVRNDHGPPATRPFSCWFRVSSLSAARTEKRRRGKCGIRSLPGRPVPHEPGARRSCPPRVATSVREALASAPGPKSEHALIQLFAAPKMIAPREGGQRERLHAGGSGRGHPHRRLGEDERRAGAREDRRRGRRASGEVPRRHAFASRRRRSMNIDQTLDELSCGGSHRRRLRLAPLRRSGLRWHHEQPQRLHHDDELRVQRRCPTSSSRIGNERRRASSRRSSASSTRSALARDGGRGERLRDRYRAA